MFAKSEFSYIDKIDFFFFKEKLIHLAFGLVLVLTLYFGLFHKSPIVINPASKSNKVSFFSDCIDNGKSVIIDSSITNNEVKIEYLLKKGFEYPYAGFEILSKGNSFIDLSSFNKIKVEINTQNTQHLMMFFLCKDDHVKDTLQRLALRRYFLDIETKSNLEKHTVSMNDFKTPNWWFTKINQSKSDFKDFDINSLRGLGFMSGPSPKLETPTKIIVRSIELYRDNTVPIVILLVAYLVFIIALYLNYTKSTRSEFKNAKDNSNQINYVPISVAEKPDPLENIFNFINEHYADAELNLVQIAKETGVNQRVVSDTVAHKYNCNLKTYINQIRINEAKRLLKESDLNIGEIAYAVGFNSPANFNRVFKSTTGMSPSEFLSI